MKYTIFGFNQKKAVEYGLDVKDLLILDYVWDMIGNPIMQHITKNEVAYVWLMHDKILEDLPILGISKRSLIGYLNKLRDLGLVLVETVHNENLRGSKSYYAISEKGAALRYDQVQKIAVSQRPSAENCSSDNLDISKSNISNQQELFSDTESKSNKEDTYKEKVEKFVADYNSICQSLPKCKRMTTGRSKSIVRILKKYSYDEILEVFNNLENSDFCKGNNNRGWRASIDFILSEEKFVAALEGRYNNKRTCNVETISSGNKRQLTPEEKERIRKNGTKF